MVLTINIFAVGEKTTGKKTDRKTSRVLLLIKSLSQTGEKQENGEQRLKGQKQEAIKHLSPPIVL